MGVPEHSRLKPIIFSWLCILPNVMEMTFLQIDVIEFDAGCCACKIGFCAGVLVLWRVLCFCTYKSWCNLFTEMGLCVKLRFVYHLFHIEYPRQYELIKNQNTPYICSTFYRGFIETMVFAMTLINETTLQSCQRKHQNTSYWMIIFVFSLMFNWNLYFNFQMERGVLWLRK